MRLYYKFKDWVFIYHVIRISKSKQNKSIVSDTAISFFLESKFDLGTLLALHGESTEVDDSGKAIERAFKEQVLENI